VSYALELGQMLVDRGLLSAEQLGQAQTYGRE
jgi:hypothetical protein